MPNVHSVLNLAETNNMHVGYWKAQKRDGNAALHPCLFLNTFAGYENIHEKNLMSILTYLLHGAESFLRS